MFTLTRVTAVSLLALAITTGASLAGPPGNGEAVTLTLETPSAAARPASNLADVFAARVEELSGGSIAVTVVYGASPNTTRTWEWLRTHLDNVRTNRVQLATAWGASLELAGVETVRALYAPFQLTSKPAAARATSGAAAATIMQGFDGSGLTGLALVPQGLSRIFAAKRPLFTVADFAGATVRTPYGPSSVAALKALGARPVDRDGDPFVKALASGAITANEINWSIGSGFLPTLKTAGNVVLYPLTDVLVANTATWNRLTASQRATLRRAATETRAQMLDRWDESAGARAFCRAGGTIVTAPARALTALRARTAGLRLALVRSPETRAAAGAISRVPIGAGPRVAACRPAGAGQPRTLPTVTALVPAGAYRKTVAYEDMVRAGDLNPLINSGIQTLTTTTGASFQLSMRGNRPQQNWSCPGTARLRNGLAEYALDGSPGCEGTFAVAWKLAGDTLTVTRTVPNDRAVRVLFGGKWRRIR